MSGLPEGWYETTIGESAQFLTGFPFSSSRFSSSGIKLIRGSNVKRSAIDWSPEIAKYWPRAEPSLRAFTLAEGDLVIAMDGALVGRSYARLSKIDLPAYLVQRVARLRGTSVHQGLLYAWIGSDQFVNHVDSVKTHTAIPHISPRDIRGFAIVVPTSLAEQSRIADALADADGLVATLERLITKKHALKQGMMQQLLTGKMRLPGFTAPWAEIQLGSVAQFLKGSGLPKSDIADGGATPCIHYGELFTHYGAEIEDVKSGTDRSDLPVRSERMDVLMPTSDVTPRGLAKASTILRDGVILGGDILIIRPNQHRIYSPFLAHTIRFLANQVLQIVRGTTIFHLYAADMKHFRFTAPDTKEQEAICIALRDAQAEINLLHRRCEKARAVKRGMTQELLTGHTRLAAKVAA